MQCPDSSDIYLTFLHTSSLDTICSNIVQNNNEIKEEHIGALYKLFGSTLFKALELIDKKRIELITVTKTSRTFFLVHDTERLYSLYQNINFCQCEVFKSNIEKQKINNICKHILACKLAFAANKLKTGSASKFMYCSENDALQEE